jgi:hypothetical protein
MSDPLAHLYADLGMDDPPPPVATSLEALTEETGGEETLSDHDLDELTLIVATRIVAGKWSWTSRQVEELGLGKIVLDGGLPLMGGGYGPDSLRFVPNAAGVEVVRRLHVGSFSLLPSPAGRPTLHAVIKRCLMEIEPQECGVDSKVRHIVHAIRRWFPDGRFDV